jgi:hypothetical protein
LKHEKPCLVLEKNVLKTELNARAIESFISIESAIHRKDIEILNIAGNRESKSPGMYAYVLQVLELVSKKYFQSLENIVTTLNK